mmetsp:Transcript_36/g.62  ORF Transcript_36/g.62 Transcript_36/m.62 type:complete len:670 (+) Transcript_36:30-2039(+)
MPGSRWYDTVYVPSDGDVARLSSAELKALVIASNGGKKSIITGRELNELKQMGEAAAIAALPVLTLKELVIRAGLSVKDVSEVEALRFRCREAMKRMRTLEMPFRPRPRGAPRDRHFPVTWRKFDIVFSGPQLGFAISLDKGGNLSVVRVTGPEAIKAGLKANDILVAINAHLFADVWDTHTFEADVLTRLLRAPRPVKLTFQIGDGRWPPTAAGPPVMSTNTLPNPPATVRSVSSGSKSGNAVPKKADTKIRRTASPPPPGPNRNNGKNVPNKATSPPPPPPVFVDVKFDKRGTLGFSINLENGRLVVVSVRETKMSPCWLAAIKSGDHLVKLNGRAFNIVDPSIFDAVVLQLKNTPRPMILTFRRRQVARPTTAKNTPSSTRQATPSVKQRSQPQPQPQPQQQKKDNQPPHPRVIPPKAATRAASSPTRQQAPAPASQNESSAAEASWKNFVQESAARETAAASASSATSTTATEPESREEGKVYRYDAIFPSDYLGIALALSRSVEKGTLHVEVTEVREKCVCTEVEIHDQLVAINGTSVDDVKDESEFNARVLQQIKAAGRPLTLTFISGNPDDSVCFSESYASDLFDDIADDEGIITQVKLIKALRKNDELAKLLKLPKLIRQEDGSRDQFTEVFHTLAKKEDKSITKREWCVGISKMAGETLI